MLIPDDRPNRSLPISHLRIQQFQRMMDELWAHGERFRHGALKDLVEAARSGSASQVLVTVDWHQYENIDGRGYKHFNLFYVDREFHVYAEVPTSGAEPPADSSVVGISITIHGAPQYFDVPWR